MIELLPFHDWLVDIRRFFHQIPELAYKEHQTSEKICEILQSLDVPFQKGIAGTGVIARLKAKSSGKTVAFRSDMDALPIQELGDRPFKSKHPGLMHACGHDAHMTIAVGIIRGLKEKDWIHTGCGEIIFIFQPAEEGGAGAKAILDSGVLDSDRIVAIFGGHMLPEFPAGTVAITSGVSNAAADSIQIRLIGKGGHGAHPYQCKDVIVISAHLILQLQGLISREISALDSAVITIGSFHAGTASNIIPEQAVLLGTLRTLSSEIRAKMIRRIRELLDGLQTSYGISAELDITEGYPLLINDPNLFEHTYRCAIDMLGKENVVLDRPRMGAEDFAFFCNKWKGMMVGIGCHDPQKGFIHGLHSPWFEIDERSLDVGVKFFSHLLETCLLS